MTALHQVIRYIQIHAWAKYSHIIAIQYSTQWCCDCHPGSDFDLLSFFLGNLSMSKQGDLETSTAAKRKRQPQYRAKEDQASLFNTFLTWWNEAHNCDPDSYSQSATYLVDNKGLNLLSKIHPSDIYSPQTIMDLLQETPEWADEFAQQIFNVIKQFDRDCVKNAIYAARLAKRTREHPATTLHEL